MSNAHTYQFGTIAKLRKIYETHTREAETVGERARQQLANAGAHAALARDAALLLNEADPEWVAECEAPIVARTLRLRAWREMIDFLEAHPEIGISDYQSLNIEQPDGERATPEYLATLEQSGLKIEHTQKFATAELWFGNHDVKLTGVAKLPEPPEVEPVTDPGAIDEHQAAAELLVPDPRDTLTLDESIVPPELLPDARPKKGCRVRVIKDLVEGTPFLNREGIVIEPYSNDGATAVRLFGTTGEGTIGFAAEELLIVPPIQLGDRVRVHEAAGGSDFPPEYQGRLGVVAEIEAGAFALNADPHDGPISVVLDGDEDASSFAVREVEVLQNAAAEPLAGQPA